MQINHSSTFYSEKPPTRSKRLKWIDQSRTYGMFLVYYGHFVEQLAIVGNQLAALQYKFIYSFHMPLFFVLSGYVYKNKKESLLECFKRLVRTRLVPVLFFNLLALIVVVVDDVVEGSFTVDFLISGARWAAMGHPSFNWITWFLVCLFTVELIHFFVHKWLKTTRHILVTGIAFFAGAWFLHRQLGDLHPGPGITNNIWFVDEALFAYPFFLLGMFLHQTSVLNMRRPKKQLGFLAVMSFLFVLTTFNLNPNWVLNPLVTDGILPDFAVRMAHSAHGNVGLFGVTAIAGSGLVFFLAQLLPANRFTLFIGQNTLILLGLNHFFFFGFGRLAPQVNSFLTSHISILLFCAGLTVVSMVICIPFIRLINHYVPHWVGRRRNMTV